MLPAATRDLVARGTVGETDTRTLLERGLRSDEREVRVAAVTALSGLASDHEWALDGLVEALASELETPERVATELDRLAPRPGRRLAPLVGHPSEVVRFYVVRLLGRYPELARRHVAALTADLSKRGARSMQGAETTNVHPGLRIQDHEEVTLRVVCLAVDEPKGDPHSGRRGLNTPRPTYTSGRTENDI